eukprot:gene31586-39016_t
MTDHHHNHIHKPASHSVSHVYVEYGHDEKFVTKHKTVVEAVLLDEVSAKKAEEEHLAEDARQAEIARLAIEAAHAAEDAAAAEQLRVEEERRAEEHKAIVANSRKSMRWPPVGARFQERVVLRHVNDFDLTGTVLYTHDTAQREDILKSTRDAKVLPAVALRRTSDPNAD